MDRTEATHPPVLVSVDTVVLTLQGDALQVVLVRRHLPPLEPEDRPVVVRPATMADSPGIAVIRNAAVRSRRLRSRGSSTATLQAGVSVRAQWTAMSPPPDQIHGMRFHAPSPPSANRLTSEPFRALPRATNSSKVAGGASSPAFARTTASYWPSFIFRILVINLYIVKLILVIIQDFV